MLKVAPLLVFGKFHCSSLVTSLGGNFGLALFRWVDGVVFLSCMCASYAVMVRARACTGLFDCWKTVPSFVQLVLGEFWRYCVGGGCNYVDLATRPRRQSGRNLTGKVTVGPFEQKQADKVKYAVVVATPFVGTFWNYLLIFFAVSQKSTSVHKHSPDRWRNVESTKVSSYHSAHFSICLVLFPQCSIIQCTVLL